ncbi:uncharacterized protein LOC130758119 isoform X1 [Actinidia eriantha]|uniref:uncharacterized protein LOC130758119 isoform X1 n=1 Tax=Actinidia eriantha TaxID=165200 RepID=UPI002590A60B|nr:uncharacterized protein LOC130758119 isoform X1 [Actinidia eriantha]XP_057468931.1 uncharacterized protein LOC130758119 isoform X1 [Actinidia eriantha]XP_057468932.1 uncharacterized protein LOC130758119 isoform X1 [Actinidia eriantha]XP_057468933.1 uncharacterized protein LOC130758119 isoform X1 [Actinidia eriantha]XP_057468934.1 uncharacterized protein LOC130758119 isoform X1 [Actinidia eriantha]
MVINRRRPLASTTNSSPESFRWPTVGRYKVDLASFESLALPELQVKEDSDLFIIDEVGKMELHSSLALPELKVKEDSDLFIIDEVGKMELYSSSFFPAVLRVLESIIPLLASTPIPKGGRDIRGVARLRNRPGATIFTLNVSNRDAIKERIYAQLVDLLQKH